MTAACTVREWALRYERRPWTLNVERQGNKWKRATLVKEWRLAFAEIARSHQMPPLDAVHVTVMQEMPNHRAMPDTGACIGAAKAAIDGLVDAGVLLEDGPEFVWSLKFNRPEVTGGRDALVLLVREAVTNERRVA